MLCNMMLASLGNLARNRLYAAINIGGLAVALAAAILIGLFVKDDLTFDHFIPGYEQVYRLSITLVTPERVLVPMATARSDLGDFLKADFAQVQAVARMAPAKSSVRRGQVEAAEDVFWSDPSIFEVLRLPVYAGDLRTALARPEGLVLTRRMARKYFGREDVIGQTLDVEQQIGPATQTRRMLVMAVLQDLPDNTHLTTEIFASGLATFSPLSFFEHQPKGFGPNAYTYVRLAPGTSAKQLVDALPAFGRRHIDPRPLLGGQMTVDLAPITAIHFRGPSDMKPSGNLGATLAIACIGGLIVIMATINFVSLMTARAGRRALEVGVRKAVGASRGHITLQFLGEAIGYSLAALILAIVLSELASPLTAALAGRPMRTAYLHHPAMLLALLGFALVLGVLAGLYPALVMASFRAASVLKGDRVSAGGSGGVRQSLAVVQFAILIGLVISALVIWRQTAFALAKGMDHGADRILVVSEGPDCLQLRDRVRRLAGVAQASCTGAMEVVGGVAPTDVTTAQGRMAELDMSPMDFGVIEMHGLKPLAGRLLSQDHPPDAVMLSGPSPDKQPSLVINATAARRLGFATPAQAVGQLVRWRRLNPNNTGAADYIFPARASEIVGVVPDFSLQSVRQVIRPTLYYVDPASMRRGYVAVKLTGENVAATLDGIAGQARALGQKQPVVMRFYSQIAQNLYADITRQTAAVAMSAALAVLIGCVGLFGLAVFTAERRIKEIGVRKAMGAATSDIVALLLQAFTRPVLLANLIAWPIAGWAMQRWLQGFAYHVALSPWYFLAGGGAAALIAVLTVLGHCIHQARAKPVHALRYE